MFYILFGVGFLARLGSIICDGLIEDQSAKIAEKIADEMLMHADQIFETDVDGDGQIDLFEFSRALLLEMGKVPIFFLHFPSFK